MNDNNYDNLKHDIRQIYNIIDNLADMNSENRHEIRAINAGLHNALRAIYTMQNKILIKELSE